MSIPVELKPVSAYVQRAKELEGRDSVIQYYCLYYAANQSMKLNPESDEARAFLIGLLDQLEALKETLGDDNEALTSDVVAQAHITNFADRVFSGADTEDRDGKATRATAKKFLAASNFFQILSDFGPLDSDVQDRIRYSKWKASDIAKAFKEGRTPHPGPPISAQEEEEQHLQQQLQQQQQQDAADAAPVLQQASEMENAPAPEVSSTANETMPSNEKTESEQEVESALLNPTTQGRQPSAQQEQQRQADDLSGMPQDDPFDAPSHDLPEPSNVDPSDAFPSAVLPSFPSAPADEASTSAAGPVPSAPTVSAADENDASIADVIPSAPVLGEEQHPSAPLPDVHTPLNQVPPELPPTTPATQRVYKTAPHKPSPAEKPIPPPFAVSPKPAAVNHVVEDEDDDAAVDPQVISQTQKHAKFAISALNYDDLTEARKQLRSALALIGG